MLHIKGLFDYSSVPLCNNRCFLLIIRLKRFLTLCYFNELILIKFHMLFLMIILIFLKKRTNIERSRGPVRCLFKKYACKNYVRLFLSLEYQKINICNLYQIKLLANIYYQSSSKKRLIHLRSTRRQMRHPLILCN